MKCFTLANSIRTGIVTSVSKRGSIAGRRIIAIAIGGGYGWTEEVLVDADAVIDGDLLTDAGVVWQTGRGPRVIAPRKASQMALVAIRKQHLYRGSATVTPAYGAPVYAPQNWDGPTSPARFAWMDWAECMEIKAISSLPGATAARNAAEPGRVGQMLIFARGYHSDSGRAQLGASAEALVGVLPGDGIICARGGRGGPQCVGFRWDGSDWAEFDPTAPPEPTLGELASFPSFG